MVRTVVSTSSSSFLQGKSDRKDGDEIYLSNRLGIDDEPISENKKGKNEEE